MSLAGFLSAAVSFVAIAHAAPPPATYGLPMLSCFLENPDRTARVYPCVVADWYKHHSDKGGKDIVLNPNSDKISLHLSASLRGVDIPGGVTMSVQAPSEVHDIAGQKPGAQDCKECTKLYNSCMTICISGYCRGICGEIFCTEKSCREKCDFKKWCYIDEAPVNEAPAASVEIRNASQEDPAVINDCRKCKDAYTGCVTACQLSSPRVPRLDCVPSCQRSYCKNKDGCPASCPLGFLCSRKIGLETLDASVEKRYIALNGPPASTCSDCEIEYTQCFQQCTDREGKDCKNVCNFAFCRNNFCQKQCDNNKSKHCARPPAQLRETIPLTPLEASVEDEPTMATTTCVKTPTSTVKPISWPKPTLLPTPSCAQCEQSYKECMENCSKAGRNSNCRGLCERQYCKDRFCNIHCNIGEFTELTHCLPTRSQVEDNPKDLPLDLEVRGVAHYEGPEKNCQECNYKVIDCLRECNANAGLDCKTKCDEKFCRDDFCKRNCDLNGKHTCHSAANAQPHVYDIRILLPQPPHLISPHSLKFHTQNRPKTPQTGQYSMPLRLITLPFPPAQMILVKAHGPSNLINLKKPYNLHPQEDCLHESRKAWPIVQDRKMLVKVKKGEDEEGKEGREVNAPMGWHGPDCNSKYGDDDAADAELEKSLNRSDDGYVGDGEADMEYAISELDVMLEFCRSPM
ncbi:hypothetical protein GQ43DRAFT_478945 [Delitschia confertaspora ATCC 74209]|uniref:CXC domain-containing protein n=1 Tax=Delitschia confertaspora ATCC 74209 TaxID=1513339 RepID=A0A9P4JUE0_9PLEO|nr:hypothetical protein GQ43DRAFT_478945 [Delitschia confertaspora ATCC 74209]